MKRSTKRERTPGRSILRPGFVGNIFFGMAASFITWGLSGPFVNYSVIGTAEEVSTKFYLSLGNIVGAFLVARQGCFDELASVTGLVADALATHQKTADTPLVGIGGARIVSNEVDKKLLSAAAVEAAGAPADSVAATTIASATPMGALKAAE